MSQTDRLAVIARLLEHGQTVTTRSLMARFEVTRATIMRDIDFLRDRLCTPVLYHPETRGFKIDKSDRFGKDVVSIPGLWLTQDEAYALLTLFNITRQLDAGIFSSFVGPLHRPIKRVLGDAGYAMLGLDRKVRVEIATDNGLRPEQISILKSALLNDQPVYLKAQSIDGFAVCGTYIPQAVVLTSEGWVVEVLAADAKANELIKISFKKIEIIMAVSEDSGSADKYKALEVLAQERREAKWPEIPDQLRDISTYHDGAYDSEHLSVYTKGANHVNSDIFVMLQDWSSHEFLENIDPETKAGKEVKLIGRKDNLPINKNLSRLLKEHFSLSLAEV